MLVAITDRPEPGVILTVRREHLRTHAGQIAFPGGRIDPGEDAVAAALREAREEILLDPAAVEVIGAADRYRTVTGYLVTPVIGVIPPDLPLEPHEHEVADWFEAPLAFLLDPANQHRAQRPVPGPRAPLLRDRLERTQDLGGNRGDDRQPVAQAQVELKLDAAQMAPDPRA